MVVKHVKIFNAIRACKVEIAYICSIAKLR